MWSCPCSPQNGTCIVLPLFTLWPISWVHSGHKGTHLSFTEQGLGMGAGHSCLPGIPTVKGAEAFAALAQQKGVRGQELKIRKKKQKSHVFLASRKVLIAPEWPRHFCGERGSPS